MIKMRPDHYHKQKKRSCSPPAGSPVIMVIREVLAGDGDDGDWDGDDDGGNGDDGDYGDGDDHSLSSSSVISLSSTPPLSSQSLSSLLS